MIRAVVHSHANARERVAGNDAVLHGLLDTLVHGGDQRARNTAAHDLVHKLIAIARAVGPNERLHAQPAVAVLTGAAGLLLMAALVTCRTANGLAIRNADRHALGHDFGAILQTVEQHRNLRLTNGGDNGLAGLLVAVDAHGRIGLAGLLDKRVELLFVAAILGLDGNAVLRVGELKRRSLDLAGNRERIARLGRQLGCHDNVAGIGVTDLGHVAAAHHIQVSQTVALAGTRVDQLKTRLKRTRQHLDKADATLLRIGQGLKHKRHRTVIVTRDLKRIAVDKRHLTVVGRRREVRRDVVHQRVDALLLDAIARKDRHKDALGNRLRQQALKLLLRQRLLAFQVLHHQLIVGLGHQLAQMVMGLLGLGTILLGNLRLNGFGAVAMARLHAHQVDDAVKVLALAPGKGHGAQARAKALLQQVHRGRKAGLGARQAVYEHRTRQAQVLGGIPELNRRRLRAGLGVNHKQSRLADAHRGKGVADKIGVARGIEHIDARALPVDRRNGRRDGKRTLDLFGVIVERGLGAVVAAQAGGLAGKVEHGLGE